MNLGIIWKDGVIINHRSFLKVLFNPVLRCFGWQIASEFENNQFVKCVMVKIMPQSLRWSFAYDSDNCFVEKKRCLV
jgi:hypothetical protein